MDIRYAQSFSDYIKIISELSSESQNASEPKTLWFRGMDYGGHPLIPSLYRINDLVNADDNDYKTSYFKLRYAEEMRTQHYIAKNYHYYDKLPSSQLEWLEVMQHHSVKTRLLDWSESAIHSLIFSVEAFLNSSKFDDPARRKQFPCVWVLNPQKMNVTNFDKLLDEIRSNAQLQQEVIKELCLTKKEIKEFNKKIVDCKTFLGKYLATDNKLMPDIKHLKCIVNLSTINDEIHINRIRLKNMILENETFLLSYLLSRIYSDGIILDDRQLSPLAIVHPFHSERIKSQKGVFTVFPFYKENINNEVSDSQLRKLKIDLNAMQYNQSANEALIRIEIVNPKKIAHELLSNGINTSWLYPELPIVANEIESHKIY